MLQHTFTKENDMTVAIFAASQVMLKSTPNNKERGYMPDWASWSIKQASQESGYHPEHLRRLLREKKIEGERIGYMWLIKIESLEKYIEENKDIDDARYGPHKK
jgi:excisionase family DNA binding protein